MSASNPCLKVEMALEVGSDDVEDFGITSDLANVGAYGYSIGGVTPTYTHYCKQLFRDMNSRWTNGRMEKGPFGVSADVFGVTAVNGVSLGILQAALGADPSAPGDASGSGGFAFRIQDHRNFFAVALKSTGTWRLIKVVDNTVTELHALGAVTAADSDVLKIELEADGDIIVTINGVARGTVNDITFQTNNMVGFCQKAATNVTQWADWQSRKRWTDVTSYVHDEAGGVVIQRGRKKELENFSTGIATIMMQNKNGHWNPSNTASPLYPNVQSRREVMVSMETGGSGGSVQVAKIDPANPASVVTGSGWNPAAPNIDIAWKMSVGSPERFPEEPNPFGSSGPGDLLAICLESSTAGPTPSWFSYLALASDSGGLFIIFSGDGVFGTDNDIQFNFVLPEFIINQMLVGEPAAFRFQWDNAATTCTAYYSTDDVVWTPLANGSDSPLVNINWDGTRHSSVTEQPLRLGATFITPDVAETAFYYVKYRSVLGGGTEYSVDFTGPPTLTGPDRYTDAHGTTYTLASGVRTTASLPTGNDVRFRGYISRMPQIPGAINDHVVQVECVDWMGLAAQFDLPGTYWEMMMLSLRPKSWWRLGDPEGSSIALDSVSTCDLGVADANVFFGADSKNPMYPDNKAARFDATGSLLSPEIAEPVRSFSFMGILTTEVGFTGTTIAQFIDSDITNAGTEAGFRLGITNPAGMLQFSVVDGVNTTTKNMVDIGPDGTSWLVVVVYQQDGVGGGCRWAIAPQGSQLSLTNITVDFPLQDLNLDTIILGGVSQWLDEVAWFDRPLTDLDVKRISDAWVGGVSTALYSDSPWHYILEHMHDVYNFMGMPTNVFLENGETVINNPVTLQAQGLTQLQQDATNERGAMFVKNLGELYFRRRSTIFTSPYNNVAYTYADAGAGIGGSLRFTAAVPQLGDDYIINKMSITTTTGQTAYAEDLESKKKYGWQSRDEQVDLATNLDIKSVAQATVAQFANPIDGFESLILHPIGDTAAVAAVLATDIETRLRVVTKPIGHAQMTDREVVVQGIDESITRNNWEVTYWLTAANTPGYMVIGDPVTGFIGFGRAGY